MSRWSLVYEGYDPDQEGLRETLCTLGNGYFATRGAATYSHADSTHYPGTYLAGGYNRLETEIAGRVIENEDLVNLPNWLPLTFRMEGDEAWFRLEDVEILSYRQKLDLRHGVLHRDVRFQDGGNRTFRLTTRRLVSMADPHLCAVEMTLEAEDWSGSVEIQSALDGTVVNSGVVRYQDLSNQHLHILETGHPDGETTFLKIETNQSELRIAQAARTQVHRDSSRIEPEREPFNDDGFVGQRFAVHVSPGQITTVEKVVSLFTSRDRAISECGLEAKEAVQNCGPFADLLRSQELSWQHLWDLFSIDIDREGEVEAERGSMILHLHVFHLLQTASPHTRDLDAGIPARGWHGEAYRGHIFWDELFIFPLLNLRLPKITRSLLLYRYRRLRRARAAAHEAGYRGAMFPWQSGSDGREETQRVHLNPRSGRWLPDNSRLQRHVNAAVAYNIWQYYQSTCDTEFMSFYGAEMILEIARFWSSIATYNRELDRYEILGVMGPDEYHDAYPDSGRPGLDNNAYTNVMAAWVILRAFDTLRLLPDDRAQKLRAELNLTDQELEEWEAISSKMRICFHDEGIISQFQGYGELQEFDWKGYRDRYGDIQRLDRILEAEDDTPNRYQVSKQTDVLMLFYLFPAQELEQLFEHLGYEFDADLIPRNVEYYLNRTSHGSTLSRVVHSWVLARSDRMQSCRLFDEALESDIADVQGGTTSEGIHLGALAGTVDIVQRGYTGLQTRDEVLYFNPCLPHEYSRVSLCFRYRAHFLCVEADHERLVVSAGPSSEEPIQVGLDGVVHRLCAGETREFKLQDLQQQLS